MRNEASVVIGCPIDEVFRLTNQHVADWSLVVTESRTTSESAEGVGTTFHLVTEENGRRMEFEGVVTRYEPPRYSAVRLHGPMFDIDAEYLFTEVPEGTEVTQRSLVTGKGFFRIFLRVVGCLFSRSGRKAQLRELNSLKNFCESRHAAAR